MKRPKLSDNSLHNLGVAVSMIRDRNMKEVKLGPEDVLKPWVVAQFKEFIGDDDGGSKETLDAEGVQQEQG